MDKLSNLEQAMYDMFVVGKYASEAPAPKAPESAPAEKTVRGAAPEVKNRDMLSEILRLKALQPQRDPGLWATLK